MLHTHLFTTPAIYQQLKAFFNVLFKRHPNSRAHRIDPSFR